MENKKTKMFDVLSRNGEFMGTIEVPHNSEYDHILHKVKMTFPFEKDIQEKFFVLREHPSSMYNKLLEIKANAESEIQEVVHRKVKEIKQTTGFAVNSVDVEMICTNQLDSPREYVVGDVVLSLNVENLDK